MKSRKLKIARHEEYDLIGLAPTWMAEHQSDPLTGMGVAHDILEHGNADRVEWQGLGGTVFVRGEMYFSNRSRGNPNASENIGSEFVQLFRLWEGQDIPDPGRTRPLQDESAEELIQETVRYGCKSTREEAEYSHDDTEIRSAQHWTREEQQARMIGWMRKGYRAAVKRWRGYSQYDLMESFCAIEKAVDTFLSHHEEHIGAEVTIRFDPKRATCNIQVLYDEDY